MPTTMKSCLPFVTTLNRLVCFLLIGTCSLGATTFVASSTYDENYEQSNQVDRSVTGYDLALLRLDLEKHFSSGKAGVCTFDDAAMTVQQSFSILFQSGIQLSVSGTSGNSQGMTASGTSATRTPISGSQALANDGGNVILNFETINGLPQEEGVVAIGFTILGRDAVQGLQRTFRAYVTYSNNTFSPLVENNYAGKETADTFVGFQAPPGLLLKSVSIEFEPDSWTQIDDLAIVLGAPAENPPSVPKQTTAGAPIGETTAAMITSYEHWALELMPTGENATAFADYDGDGVINLIEYAFFTDPFADSLASILDLGPQQASGLPDLKIENGKPVLYYVERTDDPRLLYTIELSNDLNQWTPYMPFDLKVRYTNKGRLARVACSYIPHANSALPVFARLKIIQTAETGSVHHIHNQADFDRLKEATFEPGDRILFRRGGIFSGMFAPKGSGTVGNPIQIGTFGEGSMPIINALGRNTAGILLKNVEYWEIRGIEITNTNGTNNDQGELFGIFIYNTTSSKPVLRHYRVEDCYVHDVNGMVEGKERGGIHIHINSSDGGVPYRLDDVRIVGNTIENIGGVGIANRSSHVNVESDNTEHLWTNMYVAHNFVNRTGRNNIIARASVDAVYEYNVLANSSRASTGHSIYNFTTKNIIIQHNEAYGNIGNDPIDRGGFDADWDSEGTIIQYNYSHDNMWFCGIMCRYNKGVRIRYNVSQNEKTALYFYGFIGDNLLSDIVIHNNTHYIGEHIAISGNLVIADRAPPSATAQINTAFYNNIFYSQSRRRGLGGQIHNANTQFSNNLYYNVTRPTSETNGIIADPLFLSGGSGAQDIDMTDKKRLDGYNVAAESPAIRNGVIIPNGPVHDFQWRPIPSSMMPTIGAFEFADIE